ncbi:MAG: citrate synthase, partial [Lachnospiraceae bacterium]|nr:citrate synthase [Lachnospiraceae bacterium]
MRNSKKEQLEAYTTQYGDICEKNNCIEIELYEKYGVKRGLRDKNGEGVLSGLTNISLIKSQEIVDGKRVPCEGQLLYRGYDVIDLVKGFEHSSRYGFEEIAYLLLFGNLPDADQLQEFEEKLGMLRTLPTNFTRDVIMKASSKDIMNSLTKSVLTLASYDKQAADLSISNVLRQCLMLISVFPMLSVYGYQAYNHYEKDDSLYIHRPDAKLSTAENILRLLRPDMKYSPLEAKVLDIALVLHMEHGGGNNSTFTTRVVTSSGSDTYSVIAAAISSLKGPKHGGANIKVVEM